MGDQETGSATCTQAGIPRQKLFVLTERRLAAWLGWAPGPGPWLRCLPPCDGAVCSYRPIVDYIDAQFENYLQEELKIRRSLFDYHDTRIHVCLYFITPTGHSLKSLDLVTMKKLDSKVWPPSGGSCGRPVHGGGVWSLPVTVRCIPRGLGLGACRIGLVLLLYLLLCLSLCLQPAPVDLTSSELCPCLWPWAPSLQLR